MNTRCDPRFVGACAIASMTVCLQSGCASWNTLHRSETLPARYEAFPVRTLADHGREDEERRELRPGTDPLLGTRWVAGSAFSLAERTVEKAGIPLPPQAGSIVVRLRGLVQTEEFAFAGCLAEDRAATVDGRLPLGAEGPVCEWLRWSEVERTFTRYTRPSFPVTGWYQPRSTRLSFLVIRRNGPRDQPF